VAAATTPTTTKSPSGALSVPPLELTAVETAPTICEVALQQLLVWHFGAFFVRRAGVPPYKVRFISQSDLWAQDYLQRF